MLAQAGHHWRANGQVGHKVAVLLSHAHGIVKECGAVVTVWCCDAGFSWRMCMSAWQP